MKSIVFGSIVLLMTIIVSDALADKGPVRSTDVNRGPIAESFPDCNRFACDGRPHQGTASSVRAPTPTPDVVAPPAAQRLLYRQDTFPGCSSATGLDVNGSSTSVPAVSINVESIDVPLGTNTIGLTSNHMNVLQGDVDQLTNDGGTHGVFTRILIRESGTLTWQMATLAQSSVNNSASPQFVMTSMNTVIDLASLGDPSQVDIQLAHAPTQSAGSLAFPSTVRRVCLAELEISM